MSPKVKRTALKIDTGQRPNANKNYYSPLQTLIQPNDEIEITDKNEDELEQISSKNKVYVPPITVLKCTVDQIHNICKQINCTKYSIKKISIGIKLHCVDINDHKAACSVMHGKFEYFSYADKNDRPYKALLLGLDKMDPSSLKNELIGLGLNCLDVKLVQRKRPNNTVLILYVVFFTKKSITLNELRKNHSVINYVRVKWEYQKKSSHQITQCYNCQMFGHGSNRCAVKSYCSNCAGPHKTAECPDGSTVKCANCNGSHKSNDANCPSRISYLNLRSQYRSHQVRPNRTNISLPPQLDYSNAFPNTLSKSNFHSSARWVNHNGNHTPNVNKDLFSLEEIKSLTFELIKNLRNCKTKADQFELITSLACKFVHNV